MELGDDEVEGDFGAIVFVPLRSDIDAAVLDEAIGMGVGILQNSDPVLSKHLMRNASLLEFSDFLLQRSQILIVDFLILSFSRG